jgi:hypothetical protein
MLRFKSTITIRSQGGKVIKSLGVLFLLLPITMCTVWLGYKATFGAEAAEKCMLRTFGIYDYILSGQLSVGNSLEGPSSSLYNIVLIPDALKVRPNIFWNARVVVACNDRIESASRIEYIEFRTPALTQSINAWAQGVNELTGFRKGKLTDSIEKMQEFSGRRGGTPWKWESTHSFAAAPAWLPKERINESTFIAFWGSGFLFRGEVPDQYFWIGYM